MLKSLSRRGGEFIYFFGLYVLHSSVLDEVFVISEIIKVEVAEADDTYRDLENSGYHKIESNNCSIIHCFEENNHKQAVA